MNVGERESYGKGKTRERRLRRQVEDDSSITDKEFFQIVKAKGYTQLARLLDKKRAVSRKDELGMIVYREFSGGENNRALRTAKEFEKSAGGNANILEKLEANEKELPKDVKELLPALRDPANAKRPLPVLLAENRTSLARVMRWFTKGAVEMSQLEAAIEAHTHLPAVVKDIVRHSLDQAGVCDMCLGSRKVRNKSTDKEPTLPCPKCAATGQVLVSSEHKEWAAKAVLNMTGMEKGGNGTQVNVAVINNLATGKSFAERMVDLGDRALYGKLEDEAIDAEVVSDET